MDMITWLRVGVDAGHITKEEAFEKLFGSLDKVQAKPASGETSKLKKDGTPRAKPGRKPRQAELPMSASNDYETPRVRLKKDGTPWGKRGSKQVDTNGVQA